MISASMQGEVKRLTMTKLDLAYQRAHFSIVSSLLVSSLVVAALWPLVARQNLLAWLLALWSILAVRFFFTHRFLKLNQNQLIEPDKWTTGYVIGAAATGLCWGLTVFCFPESPTDQTTILLIFVIAGVCAFASASMATIPSASNLFMVSALLPMALWLLSFNQRLQLIMALIALIYLGLMLLLSRHIHGAVLSSLVSNEQNKALTSAVQERDWRMQRFFESAPGCYFTLQRDRDGILCMPFASSGITPLFGIEPSDVTSNIAPLLLTLHPDDIEHMLHGLHQSAQVMTPFRYEFRIIPLTRGERWIVLQCMPQKTESGMVQWHGVMFDISDRKLAETALKESETRYRAKSNLMHSVLESTSNVVIYALDRNYRYLSFNHAHRDIFKTSWGKDIAVGMSILDVFDDEAFSTYCRQSYDQVLAGHHLCIESREKFPTTGTPVYRHWENHGSPIRNDQGEIVGLTVFAIEITARKQAEKSLRASEERMRFFFERQLVGMAITSPEKGWIQINEKMCNMLGYSHDELMQLTWAELTYPDDLAADVAQFDRVLSGDIDSYTLEKRFIRKDGRLVHTNLAVGCVRRSDRSVDYVLALFEDITERKRIEAELADSHNFLNKVINSISDPISVKDNAHRWILLNDTCCAMIGHPREVLLGKSDYDFFPKEQADVFWEKDDLVFKSGEVNLNEEALTSADGGVRHLLTQKSPFTFSDGQRYVVATSRDITERKAIEKALCDSEHMLQEAQRIAHIGSWDVDMVNDKLIWSDEIFRIWEIDKTKFKADFAAFVETVHPQDRERVVQAYNDALVNHSLYEVEHRLLFPDGRVKHILERGEPQYDAQGKPVRFIGTSLDITERKRAEAELQYSRNFLDLILNGISDAIAVKDRQHRWVQMNDASCVMIGESREVLLGKSDYDFFPKEQADIFQEKDELVFSTGEANVNEEILTSTSGEVRYIQTKKTPFRGVDGQLLLVAASRDITEIKRTQLALQNREREFRSLAGNIPDNIARWDVEGRYLYINPTHEHTLGTSLSEIVGTTIPDAHEQVKTAIAQVAASGKPVQVVQHADVDGNTETHIVNLVPEFDQDGCIVSVLGLGRNMTEFYRMQEAIAERERELRALAESSPGMMGAFHLRPDGSMCMPYVSAKIEELFDLRPQDVVNDATALLAMNHPDDAQRVMDTLAQSVRNMSTWHEEYRVIHPTRGELWMESNTSPQPHPDGGIIWYGYLHDITERKRTEQALQEKLAQISELNRTLEENAWLLEDQATELEATQVQIRNALEFSEGIINAIPDILFEMDRNGRYLNVWTQNPQLLAEQKMALLGKSITDILAPESAAIAMAGIREAAAQGVSYGKTIPVVQSNGETRWYEYSLAKKQSGPLSDATFIVLSRDVTERIRMADELTQREREFRSLAENLPVNIARWDCQGRYVYLNPSLERLFGSANTVIGKTKSEAFPDGRFTEMEAILLNVVATGTKTTAKRQLVPSENGEMRIHDLSLVPEFNTAGQIVGVLGIGHDMTDIYHMEDALHDNLRFTYELIEAIPGPVFYKDADGLYLGCNGAFERYYGIPRDKLIGKGVFDLWPRDLAERYHAADLQLIENPGTQIYEGQMQTPQGRRDAVFHKATFARADGSIGGQVGVILDITERKQAESAIQENLAQITALNRSLEETARDMAEQAVRLEASREQLQRTEAWYRGILHSAPDGMLVVNEHGIITLVNAQLGRMFGYTDGELIGQSIEQLVPPESRDQHVFNRNGYIDGQSKDRRMRGQAAKLQGRRKDGSEFSVDIALSRLPGIDGNENAICAAVRDVTEQQRLEKALAEREYESSTLINNTPDTIARYNRDGIRIFANQALANSVEGGLDAVLGKTPGQVPGGPQSEAYEAKLREVMATGVNTEFELIWSGKNGQDMCSHIRLTAEFDASGSVATVLAVGRDITELNAFRQKIHQMAFYDTLTSLPNRALFNDRLRQMLTDAQWHDQKAGVMLLDLDRFKAINDSMGHPAGDALLREAALRLSFCVRSYDTVARLGGDEFAILLPEIRSGDDLGRVASKILAAFNEPFLLEGKEVFVSTSIGIAVYPNDGIDADDLIKQADSAMYFAKRSGRNNFRFYSKELTASAGERLSLESELRRALERNELELYYQPKVRLADSQLVGSEALLRWNNPQRGMVPPDQFISIAEDSGLIVEIGEWVLREACRTACDWNATGKPVHKVAINLSARQFQSNDLVKTVRTVLEETGCKPEWIELEITESLLLDEQGEVLEMLQTFRVIGISIAIDDFGTGYSALSYLARFPINTLKIDRSFIRTLTTEHFRAELVKAILSIARCLGQEVVAEGVETTEQAAFLHAHGCQIAQGYLYSKPVSKAAFAAIDLSLHS